MRFIVLLLTLLFVCASGGLISFTVSFVPVPFLGGAVNVICGAVNLNPAQIGMGALSLLADGVSAGTASAAKAAATATTQAAKAVQAGQKGVQLAKQAQTAKNIKKVADRVKDAKAVYTGIKRGSKIGEILKGAAQFGWC